MIVETTDARRARRMKITIGLFIASAVTVGLSGLVDGTGGIVMMASAGVVATSSGIVLSLLLGSWMPVAWSVYFVLVVTGGVLHEAQYPPKLWTMWIIAGTTIAAAAAAMVLVVRAVGRARELDRLISVESISIAFFATMIGSLTYALLEVWVKAPRLSMWVPWSIGMFTWGLATALFQRRYA